MGYDAERWRMVRNRRRVRIIKRWRSRRRGGKSEVRRNDGHKINTKKAKEIEDKKQPSERVGKDEEEDGGEVNSGNRKRSWNDLRINENQEAEWNSKWNYRKISSNRIEKRNIMEDHNNMFPSEE